VTVGAYPDLAISTRITGVSGGTITLNGNMSSTVGDPDGSNHSPVASVSVDPGTDLEISQDPPTPNPAISAGTATFVLRPSNNGPYPASAGAQVSFPLPAGFSVNSATGSPGWSCTSAGSPVTVSCVFGGSLASGASGTLTIVTTVPTVVTTTTYSGITASIAPNTGGPVDPIAFNNTAARSLNVLPDGVDLSISKSKAPNPVALGANMVSSIVVSNAGPQTAASGTITVVDVLDPAKEQFVSASGSNWACVSAAPNVTCTYNAALGIGSSSTLSITTQALSAGVATNNANVAYSGTPGDYNPANNNASAAVTITADANSPDLMVGISAATAGGTLNRVEFNETQITYTATLTNKVIATAANAQNVVYTLSIPGRLSTSTVTVTGIVLTNTSGTSNATFTCTGTGTGSTGGVTCTQGAGTQLSPGDVVTFTVTADRPLADGSFSAAVTGAYSSTQGDPLRSDNEASTPVIIDPIADVEVVSKVLAANPVLAGTNATYTVTLRNNGPSAAAGVTLADVFTIPGGDTGFTFISASASDSGTCGGLTANTPYASGAPTVTCSWAAAVASGSTRTVTVVVRPNWQSGVAARTLDNTATVSTTTPEDSVGGQGTAPNSKSLTLNINPAQVDALINNSDVPDPLGYDIGTPANNDITYIVVTTNNGPSLATGTGFTYTMTPPAGKTITFRGDGPAANVAAANPVGNIPGSLCDQLGNSVTGPATLTINCALPAPAQLFNATSVTRHLVFRVGTAPNAGGDVYNTNATVVINETDTNAANDNESEGTTVRVRADLSVTKTPSINPVQLRQPFDWSIVVTNAGPGDSQATGLTDTLPAGMVFGASLPTWTLSSGPTGTCSVAGQTLTCAFGLVPAGQTVTVTVPGARVTSYPAGGTTQNCASATTSEVDPNSVNNLTVCSTLTVQRSSLAGTVFEDRDRAGANAGTPQASAVEPRIAGVTITLTGTDAYGNAVSRAAVTDAAGAYLFNDLSPAGAGGYTLTETQPSGFGHSPANPATPAVGGTYAAGGAGNSTWTSIALPANTAGTAYDFPELRRPSLSGFVYRDDNQNGSRDAATDTPIAGATVELLNAAGVLLQTTTTNGSGAYQFTNLDPLIVYTVREPLPNVPAGLVNGPVNPGLINGLACATGCTAQAAGSPAGVDRIASIDLSAGVDGTQFNFGEVQTGFISGVVWIDRNLNGILEGGETGRVGGVTVVLRQGLNCTGPIYDTAVTAGNGTYNFQAVPGQAYTICERQPTAYLSASVAPGTAAVANGINAITIASLPATGSPNNNFGEVPGLGSLSGLVYLDANNDGTRQAQENGLPGVTLKLTGLDINGVSVERTTTTDGLGKYSFDDLPGSGPAGYTVTEQISQPVFGSLTTANGITTAGTIAGVSTGVATPVGTTPSAVRGIVLPAGADSIQNNFGEILPVSLSGTVFLDPNDNGLQELPADTGLAGVTLVVTGVDVNGATIPPRTVTTDADGRYVVGDLPLGVYTVTEPIQPTGTHNGQTVPGSTGGTATPATTVPSAITGITLLAPGAASVQNNFGEGPGAEIRGWVYLDADDNGQKGATESGLAGVTLTLTGTDNLGSPVQAQATTAADGSYAFVGLRPGTYTVTEPTQPSATANGTTTPGTLGGAATPVGTVPSAISTIVLPAAGRALENNFGEVNESPDLRVSKVMAHPLFTVGLPGTYRITVRNAGPLPSTGIYTVDDRLPNGLTLAATPNGPGWTCTGAAGASSFRCTSSSVIAANTTSGQFITAVVNVAASAETQPPVNNAVMVDGGGEIEARRPSTAEREAFNNNPAALPECTPAVQHNACRTPTPVQQPASLSGTVWSDSGPSTRLLDGSDRRLPGWIVEVIDPATGQLVGSATTGPDGSYRVINLEPGIPLVVRFRDPASGIVYGYPVNGETAPGSSGANCEPTPAAGKASSCEGKPQLQPQLTVVLTAGKDLPQQSLPVDPSGVVYDSGTRLPVPGAVVALQPAGTCAGWNPATAIVGATLGGYRIDGSRIEMTVGADGFYQYLFGTNAPATCTFTLTVTPPADSGYIAPSAVIPVAPGTLTPSGGPGSTYAVQPQPTPPTGPVGPATIYYTTVVSGSGGANIVHNHLPLDALLPGVLALSKSGDKATVEMGDTLRYTITVMVPSGALPRQTTVLDRLPPGFTYIPGTAMLGNARLPDPQGGAGPVLAFNLGRMPESRQLVLHYRVRVGVGAQQGDGVNRAQGIACGVPTGCVDANLQPLPGGSAGFTNRRPTGCALAAGSSPPTPACWARSMWTATATSARTPKNWASRVCAW
jgi:uncharacterized repeat protein (TIGR01451 family)